MSILTEAEAIINGPRQKQYGKATDSFQRIADCWSAITRSKITAWQVALMMASLKIIRESYEHKPDNLVDAAGYLGLAEQIIDAE